MRFSEFRLNEGPMDAFYSQFMGWGKDNDGSSSAGTGGATPGKADVASIQDPDFNKKLDKIASALGVDKNAILAVMKQESGLDPKAVNKTSGATGLIQFMPATARGLGTSVEALRGMTAVQQLDYVYMYYKQVGVKPGMNAGDLYVATFMPAALGKGDGHVLGKAGAGGFSGKVYAQNKGLDRDRNGVITVADIKNSVNRFA
jgi:hypothetical protein